MLNDSVVQKQPHQRIKSVDIVVVNQKKYNYEDEQQYSFISRPFAVNKKYKS